MGLASHVLTHLLIHLSAHLCHHHYCHHPLLLHSFTPGSKLTYSTILFHLNTCTPGLPSRSWFWTGLFMLLDLFLVRFSLIFLFVPCDRLSCLHVILPCDRLSCLHVILPCDRLSCLHVILLLHVK